MKNFPEAIFSRFSENKQGKIIVEWAHHVEKNWRDGGSFLQLKKYTDLSVVAGYDAFSPLQKQLQEIDKYRSGHNDHNDHNDLDVVLLKDFVASVVPLERRYYRIVKEHEVPVRNLDREENRVKRPLIFVLHNIRSTFNIGSFFRTAECLGCEQIYLCGYTATADHLGVQKTSMGTSENMKWTYDASIENVIEGLKADKYQILGLETVEGAVSIYDLDFPQTESMPRLALVFGNEYFGLEQRVLDLVDQIIEVPVFGQKNSLNVAVCASVCGYELVRRWL